MKGIYFWEAIKQILCSETLPIQKENSVSLLSNRVSRTTVLWIMIRVTVHVKITNLAVLSQCTTTEFSWEWVVSAMLAAQHIRMPIKWFDYPRIGRNIKEQLKTKSIIH